MKSILGLILLFLVSAVGAGELLRLESPTYGGSLGYIGQNRMLVTFFVPDYSKFENFEVAHTRGVTNAAIQRWINACQESLRVVDCQFIGLTYTDAMQQPDKNE